MYVALELQEDSSSILWYGRLCAVTLSFSVLCIERDLRM